MNVHIFFCNRIKKVYVYLYIYQGSGYESILPGSGTYLREKPDPIFVKEKQDSDPIVKKKTVFGSDPDPT